MFLLGHNNYLINFIITRIYLDPSFYLFIIIYDLNYSFAFKLNHYSIFSFIRVHFLFTLAFLFYTNSFINLNLTCLFPSKYY